MPPIKFLERLTKFMISLSLSEKFCCQNLIMKPPVILLLAVPRRLFCFGSLVNLDGVCRYLSLLLLFINIKTGKIDVKC